MTGRGLAKRIVLVLLAALAFLLFLAVVDVEATPIKPDVKKALAQSQESASQFAPARAGWDGPEMPKMRANPNVTLENLSPAAAARAMRMSLLAAAVPDLRAIAAILLVILLLRRIRKSEAQAKPTTVAAVPRPPDAPEEPVELRPAA